MGKRYKKMKSTLLSGASTGIVAGMLLVGTANTAFAETDYKVPAYSQNATVSGMHMMHRWNSKTKINSLASHLGLDQSEIQSELKAGKTLKQILQEHGIVPGQLGAAYGSGKRLDKKWNKK
jgi:hypothetical protein